ncbi:MAG: family 10 glycosylhydrolase [Chthoniobacteraceae bacterium]
MITARWLISFLILAFANVATAEFRGAWVASVHNLDWPSRPGLSAGAQQAELRGILDRAASLKLNAILLQVRPSCDALYESSREPWSAFLTGKQGASPGYDPLAFAIAEAHRRGIELHAWFNPFRAAVNSGASFASSHVSRTHPEWVRRHGSQLWLDPGEPAAREHVLGVMLDVVRRYDIDGLHIDDYFYPYPAKGAPASFADEASWKRIGAKSGLSRADWRRDNINRFVEAMYRGVKKTKSSVKVGISPFGIWRPGVPETTQAFLDAYSHLFADSRLWLREGWCDYFTPQLYWSIDPPAQSFPVLLKWWREQAPARVAVWPGIATDRIGKARPAREILRQIDLTRQGTSNPGHIHWNMKALMTNRGGIVEALKGGAYGGKK